LEAFEIFLGKQNERGIVIKAVNTAVVVASNGFYPSFLP
jgi:hypothetical protein